MTGHPQGQGEVAGAVIHIQQTQLIALHVAGVLAGDDQLLVRIAAEPALGGVAHLQEQGIGLGKVAQLTVREAVEVHGGRLEPHADLPILQLHLGAHRDIHGPLMGHDSVVHRVLGAGFMEVDLYVDLLGVDHLGHRVGHLLGQGAVLDAGIAPVQVTGLGAGEALAGGVGVDVRIGPLIDGIGGTGAVVEHPLLPGRGGEVQVLGRALQGVVVGETGGVDAGDDVHGALRDRELLQHDDGRHVARRLVAVGAAQDQDAAALLLALDDVHLRIADGALQVLVVPGELEHLGDIGAFGDDILHEVALLIEAVTGDRRTGDGDSQDDTGAENAFFLHRAFPLI